MEIVITRITEENFKAFEPLMPGYSLDDFKLCVGAIVDDTACGVCLFDFLSGALILDYIYVAEKYRRNKVAATMIKSVKALAENAGELPMHVNYPEFSEDLHGLFLSLGFLLFRDGKAYRVSAGSMVSSKAFNDMMRIKAKHNVKKLSGLTEDEKLSFKGALHDEECDTDIIDDVTVSMELSYFAFDEKTGDPEACLLCRENGDTIVILYMFIFRKDATALIDIIRTLKDDIEENRNIDKTEIIFVTRDNKVEAFAKKMAGDDSLLTDEGTMISAILA